MMKRPATPAPPAGPTLLGKNHAGIKFSSWRPKGTRDWLLMFTVAGEGQVISSGVPKKITVGQAVLYAPGTPQDYSSDGSWEILWAHFMPPLAWQELLGWTEISPGIHFLEVMDHDTRRAIESSLMRSWTLSLRRLHRRKDFVASALHEALLWCDTENPASAEQGIDPRVQRALDLMTKDFQEPFSLSALAKGAGLSVSRLSQLFKKQIGSSPRQYSEIHRIDYARRLLERTHATVSEAAHAAGFPDPFYFSTRFRKIVGQSPKQHSMALAELDEQRRSEEKGKRARVEGKG